MKYLLLIFSFFLFACSKVEAPTQEVVDVTEKQVILALWDSLTAGYWVEENENYPSKLQKKLDEKGYHYEVINAWVSGDTSANVLSRASLYLEKKPNIVILVVGGNDALRWLSTLDLKKNIWAIIDTFPAAKIVLGGMDIPANLGAQYRSDFKKVYTEIAQEKWEISFLPFFLDWVAGNPDLNISDMIHPNGKWYDIIITNLMKFLEENKIITQ